MAALDRGRGVTGSLGMKAPCVVATTGPITLSALQTIDGVLLLEGDRVLVKDQADTTTNGIYVAALSLWDRAPDFDGPDDVLGGTKIPVNVGTVNADSIWGVSNTGEINIGVTALTFENFATSGSAGAALAAQVAAEAARDASQGYADDSSDFADNAAASAILANTQLTGTSATNLGVGAGAKVFATQDGRAFNVGVFIVAYSAADPTKWMIGQSTAYGAGSLTLTVGANDFNGVGNFADWILQVSGARGPTGPTGPAGAGTGDMLKADNLSGLANYATARTNLGLAIGSDVQAYDANTAKTNIEQTFTKQQTPFSGALTDGATVNWDADVDGQVVTITTAASRTFAAPTNINDKGLYVLQITTGGFTPSFNTAYKFADGVAPSGLTGLCIFTFVGTTGNVLRCTGYQTNVS
jgi:hypothetical protein